VARITPPRKARLRIDETEWRAPNFELRAFISEETCNQTKGFCQHSYVEGGRSIREQAKRREEREAELTPSAL